MTKPDEIHLTTLDKIDETYGSLRLMQPRDVERVRRHLTGAALLSPLLCNHCPKGNLVLLDGFKRLRVLREQQASTVSVRVVHLSEATARAAILAENRGRTGVCELEEAWVIQSLVRQCGVAQKEVAALLRRDVSWVSRRLHLAERLEPSVQADMRLGLVHPTIARDIVHLPRGKQAQVIEAIRDGGLTTRQVSALVRILLNCDDKHLSEVLADPLRYLEPRKERNNTDERMRSGKQKSLGAGLLRLLEAAQQVDLLLAVLIPQALSPRDAATLSQEAPRVIEQLERTRLRLEEILEGGHAIEVRHV